MCSPSAAFAGDTKESKQEQVPTAGTFASHHALMHASSECDRSWVEAGLLALQHRSAGARRADESDHAVDIAGAMQSKGTEEDKHRIVDYR